MTISRKLIKQALKKEIVKLLDKLFKKVNLLEMKLKNLKNICKLIKTKHVGPNVVQMHLL